MLQEVISSEDKADNCAASKILHCGARVVFRGSGTILLLDPGAGYTSVLTL